MEVKWIKLDVGFQTDSKIKQIRKLPNGDSVALMWIFLLCRAGEINDNGYVYLTKNVAYSDEMLATEFNIDVNTIRLGLNTFEEFGMIEREDGFICLCNWEKWQSLDRLEEIREQNRIRKQRQREKEKLLFTENSQSNVKDKLCDSHVTVTQCHAIEQETEQDKDTDTDKDREVKQDNKQTNKLQSGIVENPVENKQSLNTFNKYGEFFNEFTREQLRELINLANKNISIIDVQKYCSEFGQEEATKIAVAEYIKAKILMCNERGNLVRNRFSYIKAAVKGNFQ